VQQLKCLSLDGGAIRGRILLELVDVVAVRSIEFVTHELCDDLTGGVESLVSLVVEPGRRSTGGFDVLEQL